MNVVIGRSGLAIPRMSARQWLAAACVVLAAILVVAGCTQANTQPTINGARLIGTWVGSRGATMNFMADHTVVVRALNLGYVGPAGTCRSVSASGTWQFDGPQGASGISPDTYAKGNIIQVEFPPSQPITTCDSQFTTWEINPPLKLCLYLDPDTPCGSSYTLVKQR